MKKLGRIFSSLISLTLFFFGVFVVTKVAIPLFDPKFNEIEKQKFVGMRSAIPMEFDSENKPFWWMVQPHNYLQFTNSSDEEIVGKINLVFSSNPCKNEGIMEFGYGAKLSRLEINPNIEAQNIQIPVILKPRDEFPVRIRFLEMKKCKPVDEDVRNFGAKLISWNFL
jgi:hypothetical protein